MRVSGKPIGIILAMALTGCLITGCGQTEGPSAKADPPAQQEAGDKGKNAAVDRQDADGAPDEELFELKNAINGAIEDSIQEDIQKAVEKEIMKTEQTTNNN